MYINLLNTPVKLHVITKFPRSNVTFCEDSLHVIVSHLTVSITEIIWYYIGSYWPISLEI